MEAVNLKQQFPRPIFPWTDHRRFFDKFLNEDRILCQISQISVFF